MTLRYGIIGAGVVAPMHLEAIAALDDVELVGISALDGAHALAEDAGTRAFTDNDELLGLGLDVVVVATPHPSHPALTIAALETGAHVLVEKPLAVQVREADAMIAAADDAGRLLGVCFQQRFRPVIAAARAADRPPAGSASSSACRSSIRSIARTATTGPRAGAARGRAKAAAC